MSADNWAICPKCQELYNANQKARILGVAEKYGKIPAEEYIKLSKEVSKEVELEATLREDYEFYIDDDGKFFATYSAECAVCDFHFKFKESKQVFTAKS